MRRRVTSLLSLLVFTFPVFGQADFSKVEIETVQLAEGIYMLTGAGGNIGASVGEDGVFLIDDQYAQLSRKIRAAVAMLCDTPIRFVFNTHYHADHVDGNKMLGEAGALIVAHDNVYKRMSSEQFMSRFGRTIPPYPDVALPVISFAEEITFHVNGDDLHGIHLPPGHTDGDAMVIFPKANVVHMGDVFFNGMFPFIDLDAGGGINGIIKAVDRALEMVDNETKIIPGHGPLSDKAGLEAYHAMLTGVRDAIQQQIDDGKSLDETKAANPLAPWAEAMGGGFMSPDVFTEIVYESLTK